MRRPAPDIDRVVRELWDAHRATTDELTRASAYSRILLDAFFLGDREVWRAWGERAPHLPRLRDHDLPVSYDRLKRMIRVSDLWERLPADLRASLGITHVEVLCIALTDTNDRLAWAERAAKAGWEAAELRRRLVVARGGMPELDLLQRAIEAVEKAAAERQGPPLGRLLELSNRLASSVRPPFRRGDGSDDRS